MLRVFVEGGLVGGKAKGDDWVKGDSSVLGNSDAEEGFVVCS